MTDWFNSTDAKAFASLDECLESRRRLLQTVFLRYTGSRVIGVSVLEEVLNCQLSESTSLDDRLKLYRHFLMNYGKILDARTLSAYKLPSLAPRNLAEMIQTHLLVKHLKVKNQPQYVVMVEDESTHKQTFIDVEDEIKQLIKDSIHLLSDVCSKSINDFATDTYESIKLYAPEIVSSEDIQIINSKPKSIEASESVNPIYQFIDKVLVAHGLLDYRTLSLNCLYVMYQSWAMSEGVKSSFKLTKFNELIFQEFEKRQLSFEKNQCQASTIQNQFPTSACEDLLSSSLSIQSQWKDVMQVKKHQVIKFTNIPKATNDLRLADIQSHQDFAQVKRSFLKKMNSGDASIISEIISFFHGSIDNHNDFFLLSYDDFLELTNSSKNDD